jgi:hypothetical protein
MRARRLEYVRAFLVAVVILCVSGQMESAGATLDYATYFGGSAYDGANSVTVDSTGNVYIAGATSSADFPLLNPLQQKPGGQSDGFVAKFSPSGQLLFSTCFGGSGDDIINAIRLHPSGDLVLVGTTHSTDLPTTESAFQPAYKGGTAFGSGDGFIARITPDGSQLLYCSYFGGSGDEELYGLAIDSAGNIAITGWTDSDKDLPLKNALQPKFGGGTEDGFVAKFDSTLTNLLFSTFLGGGLREVGLKIAIDPAGSIYVSGMTSSTNFPVTAATFQTNHLQLADTPNWDGFVAKLKPDGSALVYSTYIGGAGADSVLAIAVDSGGNAYLTGETSTAWQSANTPLGFGRLPADPGGDAWVGKLTASGSQIAWFSYLGGTSSEEYGLDILLAKDGSIYVAGLTTSSDFPIVDAAQPQLLGGARDTFVSQIAPDGQRLIYSTFLGGSGEDSGAFLALATDGDLVVVGQTSSRDFPIRDGFQSANASAPGIENPDDAYIVKLSRAVIPPSMQIAPSGINVLISWPTNFSGFNLQSASSPSQALWTNVPAKPLLFGKEFVVVQKRSTREEFFRLYRP